MPRDVQQIGLVPLGMTSEVHMRTFCCYRKRRSQTNVALALTREYAVPAVEGSSPRAPSMTQIVTLSLVSTTDRHPSHFRRPFVPFNRGSSFFGREKKVHRRRIVLTNVSLTFNTLKVLGMSDEVTRFFEVSKSTNAHVGLLRTVSSILRLYESAHVYSDVAMQASKCLIKKKTGHLGSDLFISCHLKYFLSSEVSELRPQRVLLDGESAGDFVFRIHRFIFHRDSLWASSGDSTRQPPVQSGLDHSYTLSCMLSLDTMSPLQKENWSSRVASSVAFATARE